MLTLRKGRENNKQTLLENDSNSHKIRQSGLEGLECYVKLLCIIKPYKSAFRSAVASSVFCDEYLLLASISQK